MNANELKNLVSKITKARKIQKDRIDEQSEFQRLEDESISKLQAPVIKEIGKQGAITQRSLFNQSTAARKAIQLQEKQLKELEKFPRTIQAILPPKPVATEEPQGAQAIVQLDSPDEFSTPGKSTTPSKVDSPERLEVLDPDKPVSSVQRFYGTYRNQHRSKSTQFELNFNTNTIGQRAEIDLPELINNDHLVITFKDIEKKEYGRKVYPKEALTPGFLGLLLLPYDDMKQAGINPTKRDLEYYITTMKYAGFIPSSSAKYKKYVQPYVKDSAKQTGKEGAKDTPKTGKGLFVYKHPKELEDRLSILVGSIHAGNNSTAVKSEVKSIVDKLFELGYLTHALHRKFFAKYNL